MDQQPSLLDQPARDYGVATVADIGVWRPAVEPPAWACDGLPARFWEFHTAHPEVADALARLARQLARRGHRRISVAMCWETLRYRTMLGAVPGEEPWRLNNSYRAYYSRWLMELCPDLVGVFEIRESQAEVGAAVGSKGPT